METAYKRKRLNYSIKKEMQVRLLLKVLSVSLASTGLMAATFYLYSNRKIGGSYRMFHIHAQNFLDYLLPAIAVSVLLTVLLAVAIALFFPHRIAGPLFRIERDLKERVGEGDLSVRFSLRKGDELTDLADAINISLEKLKQRIEDIKQPAERLEALVAQGRGDEGIAALAKEINAALGKFKL
ncbi:MAG: methyl-accepting chemotaxis protein [Nitrospirota bacterium]